MLARQDSTLSSGVAEAPAQTGPQTRALSPAPLLGDGWEGGFGSLLLGHFLKPHYRDLMVSTRPQPVGGRMRSDVKSTHGACKDLGGGIVLLAAPLFIVNCGEHFQEPLPPQSSANGAHGFTKLQSLNCTEGQEGAPRAGEAPRVGGGTQGRKGTQGGRVPLGLACSPMSRWLQTCRSWSHRGLRPPSERHP